MSGPLERDGCEWSPEDDRPALSSDVHHQTTPAMFIIGADGQWRLCSSCAVLPRFKRFRTKRIIPQRTERSS